MSNPSLVFYVAGPMSGRADLNRPTFDKIAAWIERAGGIPVIPHGVPPFDHRHTECPEKGRYPASEGGDHGGLCHLRADLIVMLGCDAVVMVPGWRRSRGASVEFQTARAVGMPISFYDPRADLVVGGSHDERET